MSDTACPCGSNRDFAECCGPYLDGISAAPTAEALMRSRYSAFVRGEADYLLATWHVDTRPAALELEPGLKWLGLRIVAVAAGGADAASGTVEFVARCKRGGRAERLHEVSRFVRSNGRWVYLNGVDPQPR
ncbi:MAG: SEC-C domain-containing protein [Gammaproteobacteria bacterium]|nr:SEC-C domain-containing protein [Gammaproteobacteria bacterium]MCP5201436.1 SEC-C domain-containing protein [Gammaproteobacteria bacterium]